MHLITMHPLHILLYVSYRVRILISLKLFVQTSYNAKEGMGVLNWEVNRKFLKGLLALKFRASISKNGISPGISF